VNTGLDENQSELRVLVLSVSLKMLADSDGLQEVSIRTILTSASSTDLLD